MLGTTRTRVGKRLAHAIAIAALASITLGAGTAWAAEPEGWVERDGERYIDDAHGDMPGWMHFDEVTGAVTYGPKDVAGKRVNYDDVTGRMLYGWHEVDIDRDGMLERCHFDELIGALISAQDLQTPAPSQPSEPGQPSQPSDPTQPEQPSEPSTSGLDTIVCTNGDETDAHYHNDWCPALANSQNLRYLTAEQALASGLTPCGTCNPPA